MRVRCVYADGIFHRPVLVKDQVYSVLQQRDGFYYLDMNGQLHGYPIHRFIIEPDVPFDFATYNGTP